MNVKMLVAAAVSSLLLGSFVYAASSTRLVDDAMPMSGASGLNGNNNMSGNAMSGSGMSGSSNNMSGSSVGGSNNMSGNGMGGSTNNMSGYGMSGSNSINNGNNNENPDTATGDNDY